MGVLLDHLELFQILITAVAGFLGIGIGIGLFKGEIKQMKDEIKRDREDIDRIKHRQSKLRGEDNGGTPVFVTLNDCGRNRGACSNIVDSRAAGILKDLSNHTASIKSLDNFARWWMQKEGLSVIEINKILGRE